MAVVSMKQLLEAGVHFGHQTRRWNPKMKPFIYTERNGIHIIDLQKTVQALDHAYGFVTEVTRGGGKVLFVGTKKQAQEAVAEEAARAGQYFVNQRWLGGLLTNFKTIQKRLDRLEELEQMRDTGMFERLPKKEQLKLNDQIAKLSRMLGGIRGMRRLPDVLFVIDTKKEHIALHEAERLDIPVVALVDTNANPEEVEFPIPANDDAIRAVRLLSNKMAEAAALGAQEFAATHAKEEAEDGFEPEEFEGYVFEPEGYVATIEEQPEETELLAGQALEIPVNPPTDDVEFTGATGPDGSTGGSAMPEVSPREDDLRTYGEAAMAGEVPPAIGEDQPAEVEATAAEPTVTEEATVPEATLATESVPEEGTAPEGATAPDETAASEESATAGEKNSAEETETNPA